MLQFPLILQFLIWNFAKLELLLEAPLALSAKSKEGEEDQVSDPHSRTARLHAAKFFPFFFPLLLEKFFIFSPFLNFFCEDWNFYFSLLGEYICEVETFGDPIHQINHLNVLGK